MNRQVSTADEDFIGYVTSSVMFGGYQSSSYKDVTNSIEVIIARPTTWSFIFPYSIIAYYDWNKGMDTIVNYDSKGEAPDLMNRESILVCYAQENLFFKSKRRATLVDINSL